MSFVNPETLRKIFARDPSAPQGRELWSMIGGAGAGMAQAAGQPGASFAQALGGGAHGMMQGQHQHQQRQYMQQQIELQRQKMEEQRQRAKGWQEILYGPQGDFASQVDTGGVPSQQTALSGAQITPDAQRGAVAAQQMPPQDVPIGTLGSMFESNGRADAINTGQGDPGGASYGRYQLASRTGTLNSFFESEEGQPFRAQFGDLEPGTPQFDQVWQEVANDPQVGPQFDQAQQQYMERTHFRPNLERAQRSGFDVSNPGVREAVVSMGTQHSPAGNLRIFNEAAARVGPDATPQQMVDALYEARTNYVRNLPEDPEGDRGMTPQIKQNVLARYERERAAAQQLTQVGLPQPAQQVLGGQQAPQNERSGYERAGGGGLNIPDEVRPLLAILGPERGAQLLAQQAFASPAEQPAAVREALFMAGGDVDLARRIMFSNMTDTEKADFEKRIDAVMAANPGTTRGEATNFVLGVTGMDVSPNTGRVTRTNQLGGEAYEVPVQSQDQLPPIEPAGPTAWDLLDASNATGIWGGTAEIGNRTLGQLGFSVGEDTTTARRYFQQLENDILRAFQESPRFAEGEAARIKEELQLGPGILRSESTLRAGLKSSASSLATRLSRYRRAANNTRLGDTTRREAAEKADVIEWALARLGVPEEEAVTGGTVGEAVTGGTVGFSPEDQALIDRWTQ